MIRNALVVGVALGAVACSPTPRPPKQLPADTLQVMTGAQSDQGYLQEVRLPSGTRCVVFSASQKAGLDCTFPRAWEPETVPVEEVP